MGPLCALAHSRPMRLGLKVTLPNAFGIPQLTAIHLWRNHKYIDNLMESSDELQGASQNLMHRYIDRRRSWQPVGWPKRRVEGHGYGMMNGNSGNWMGGYSGSMGGYGGWLPKGDLG